MNGVHLRALSQEDLAERLVSVPRGGRLAARRAARAGCRGHAARPREDRDARRVRALLPVPVRTGRDRAGGARAHAREPACRRGAGTAAERLEALEQFDVESIERTLRELTEQLGLKPKAAFAPIRIALTGRTVAPGLFESAALLGQDEVVTSPRRPLARCSAEAGGDAAREPVQGDGEQPITRTACSCGGHDPGRGACQEPSEPACARVAAGRHAAVPTASCPARPARGWPGATRAARSTRVSPAPPRNGVAERERDGSRERPAKGGRSHHFGPGCVG